MAKRIIEISVNDEYVVGSGVVIGAAGSDESVILRVTFGDTWVGLNIYATFRDPKGESPTVELLMPSMLVPGEAMKYDVVVPAASTKYDGKMSVVFSGFEITADNIYDAETGAYNKLVYRDAVINTTNAYFRVLPSDFSALDVKDEAEATVLEKVLSEINAFRGELDDVEKEVGDAIAEQGEVIVAQNERIGEFDEGDERSMAERLAEQDKEIARIAKKADSINNYDLTDADIAQITQKVLSEFLGGDEVSY